MPDKKRRTLRPDELELWSRVIENTKPIGPPRPIPPDNQSLSQPKTVQNALPRFRVGETAPQPRPVPNLAPPISDQIARQPVSMDFKRYKKMKRGGLKPEARIDLHGMTLAQAHPALTRFVLDAAADGLRLVLVITGKGKTKSSPGPIPERLGALRHQVPHWLHMPPLKAHVLQISEAHTKHGGHGAYYVYLRRGRA